MKLIKSLLISAPLLASTSIYVQPVNAFTECQVLLKSIWTGDDGVLWLDYTNTGSASISRTDPDVKNILDSALTALANDKSIVVRYAANGVSCTGRDRSDVLGIRILR